MLDKEPTDDVTVMVTSDTPGAATVNTAGGTAGPTQTLTFTTSNWDTAQTIAVTGVDDDVDNPGERDVSITYTTSSTDANYNDLTVDPMKVAVTDDDPTTVTLAAAMAGDVAEGGSKTFTITLGKGLVNGESLTVP